MFRTLSTLLTLTAMLSAVSVAAQPVGDEFQVNSFTTGDQDNAAVAMAPTGEFIVVWQSMGSGGDDDSETSVQGQRYAADGSPIGAQFQINSFTPSEQTRPTVATDAAGAFVVTWFSYGSSGEDTDWSIQGQLFDAAGVPDGGEFQVNTYTTNFQYSPSVARTPVGDFVVAWASYGSSGDDNGIWSIQAQRYDSAGVPLGSEFQVNSYTAGAQTDAAVAMTPAGDFVVVWQSYGSSGNDDSENSIQGQRYAADGTPLGGEFQINTYTTSYQFGPSVAVNADGEFIVAWSSLGSFGSDPSTRSVQARRYASDGTPMGPEFQVNEYTTNYQVAPSVALDPDGQFMVSWKSVGSDGSDASLGSIQGRRYDSAGEPYGSEFQINTFTPGEQKRPAIDMVDGSAVVAWVSDGSGGDDSSGLSVQSQRFAPKVIFVDGFESGDTAAWSTTVP